MIHAIEETTRREKEFSLLVTKPQIPNTNPIKGRNIEMNISPPNPFHLLDIFWTGGEIKKG
jgi:hypothetical protein